MFREQPSCRDISLTPDPRRANTRISTFCSWLSIDGPQKADILARMGQFYFDEVGQFSIGANTIFKYQLANLQQQQIMDAGAAKIGDARLKLVEGTGTATAAAASGGVEGNSVDQLLRSFASATGRDEMFINQQTDNELTQVTKEKQGFQMDADARKRALLNQMPNDPSMKIAGRFLTAAFQTGKSYMDNTTKTKDGSGLFGRRFG